jgi:hypothetical protein
MTVRRLIELLEKEDPDAEVVQILEDLFYPVVRLVERRLVPTQIRNTFTNELVAGFKPTTFDEGRIYIEAQY